MIEKREPITAWVTKYALTLGIRKEDGVVQHDINPGMFCYGKMNSAFGKDWHRSPLEALARAEEMRKAKIAVLKKTLAKLENMKFVVEE